MILGKSVFLILSQEINDNESEKSEKKYVNSVCI